MFSCIGKGSTAQPVHACAGVLALEHFGSFATFLHVHEVKSAKTSLILPVMVTRLQIKPTPVYL